MYYHNSVLAFVFGFERGRLRAQKERLLGLIARPFLFPTLGAASADPNVLPRWAQSQMLIPNEDCRTIYGVYSVTARLTPKPVRRTRTAFSGISKFVTPTFTAGIALREYWGIIVSCVTVVQPFHGRSRVSRGPRKDHLSKFTTLQSTPKGRDV